MWRRFFGVALLTCLGSDVVAGTYFGHGADCQQRLDQGLVSKYDGYGIHNSAGGSLPWNQSAMTVLCNGQWSGVIASGSSGNAVSATIYYQDLDDDSVVGGLSCHLVINVADGTSFVSADAHSCSTTGGCSTATPSFLGNGKLSLSVSIYSPPPGYPAAGFTVKCIIPPPLEGLSYVYGYSVTTT